MKINIYSIEKKTNENVKILIDEYIKMASKFANLENIYIFNNKISKAQKLSKEEAISSYEEAYLPKFEGFCICLDEKGESVDSLAFSQILEKSKNINFFIGGAYGFSKEFLQKAHKVISLSKLTYAHKIAKLVLVEQIYRGLCIAQNHPYHK